MTLDRLPLRQAAMLTLFLDGLGLFEIAEVLNLPYGPAVVAPKGHRAEHIRGGANSPALLSETRQVRR
jgi:hypothetical protein